MPKPTDAPLSRRDMLTLIKLLDNLNESWPDNVPPVPYFQRLRLRLAKSSYRSPLQRSVFDVRLPRAEATASARILLELLAEKPGVLGIQNPAQLRNAFHVVVKLLPSPQGKRKKEGEINEQLRQQIHPTTKWRRKKKEETTASSVLLKT